MATAEDNFDLEPEPEEVEGVPTLDSAPEPEPEEDDVEEVEAQAPEPEAAAEEEEAPEPEQPKKMVELAALHEERQRRKELEAKIATMDQRFQEFQQRLTQPKPDEPKVPDFDEDPASNLDARQKAIEKQLAEQRAMVEQQAQQAQQMEQVQQFTRKFQAREQEFASKQEDYYQAADWLRDARTKELQTLGYDTATAKQLVDQEAISYAWVAEQNSVDPAEMFYTIARQRGYAPKGASQQPAQQVQRLKQNVPRARSLGPSGATPGEISIEDLANMSEEDFDKYTSGDRWERLWQ